MDPGILGIKRMTMTKDQTRIGDKVLNVKHSRIGIQLVILFLEYLKLLNHASICIPVRSLIQGRQTSN